MPEDGTSIAYFDDVYGRDTAQLADDRQQQRGSGRERDAARAPPPIGEEGDVLRDRAGRWRRAPAGSAVTQRQLAHQAVDGASPLERAMRQLDTLPSRLTRMVTPTTPLGSPVDDSRRYSQSGILRDPPCRGEARIIR